MTAKILNFALQCMKTMLCLFLFKSKQKGASVVAHGVNVMEKTNCCLILYQNAILCSHMLYQVEGHTAPFPATSPRLTSETLNFSGC